MVFHCHIALFTAYRSIHRVIYLTVIVINLTEQKNQVKVVHKLSFSPTFKSKHQELIHLEG